MGETPNKVHSVLIIDDDKDEYEIVAEAIHEINPSVTVTFVNSCEEIHKYRHEQFDLILLDINMPRYDGFQWLKSIRKQGYHNLPIIMYTNSLSPAHIAKAYEEGANLYFTKPEEYSSLIASFRKLIEMDWSDLIAIRNQYQKQGHYATFAV